MNHLYIISTVIFGVASQLLMRWQVGIAGALPEGFIEKCFFIFKIFLSPWVILAFFCTFVSGVSWMLTLTKFDISYAYPFTSLQFVSMLLLGMFLFGEPFSITKLLGTIIVVGGLIIITRG